MKRTKQKAADADDQAAKDRVMEELWSNKPSLKHLMAIGELSSEGLPAPLFHQLRLLRWRLRREREARGLSQEAAAKAMGIDGPALSRIESGQTLQPTLLTLWKLADSLGLELTLGVQPTQAVSEPVERPKSKPKPRAAKPTAKK